MIEVFKKTGEYQVRCFFGTATTVRWYCGQAMFYAPDMSWR